MGSRFEALQEYQSTLFFFLIFFFFFFFFFQTRGATADVLSPLLSPLFNHSCEGVHCGRGSCKVSSSSTSLGFSCECNPGWTKFLNADGFEFLPCVIPSCTLNYSCSPGATAPAPPSAPPPDLHKLDACSVAWCGEGKCLKTSVLSYRCDCRAGHSNLLNISYFPCFHSCVLSMDCFNLGIGTGGWSSPLAPAPAPPPSPQSGASAPRPLGPGKAFTMLLEKLLQLVLFSVQMIFLSGV